MLLDANAFWVVIENYSKTKQAGATRPRIAQRADAILIKLSLHWTGVNKEIQKPFLNTSIDTL